MIDDYSAGTKSSRRGRPRDADVPARIAAAASSLFAQRGYSGTSVRGIAAAAQTDASIVLRHFGSKDQLFLRTMVVDYGDRDLVGGPIEGLGRRLLARVVEEADDSVPSMFRALSNAADRPEVRAYLNETGTRRITQPLQARLTGAAVELRAHLINVAIHGLLDALWVKQDPEIASQPLAEVLDYYGRTLQALIDEPGEPQVRAYGSSAWG